MKEYFHTAILYVVKVFSKFIFIFYKLFLSCCKNNMAEKKKMGRPKVKDKVKVVSVYLKESQQTAINKKYGNATEALRAEVLPKCG